MGRYRNHYQGLGRRSGGTGCPRARWYRTGAWCLAAAAVCALVLGQPVAAAETGTARGSAAASLVKENAEQKSSGKSGKAGSGSSDGGWSEKKMTALEASKEASKTSREMVQAATTRPRVLREIRTYDGTGTNLLQDEFYDLDGRCYARISYGNLTASMRRFQVDEEGQPAAGSYIAMDFAGNDSLRYSWQYQMSRPGNGTLQFDGVSDEVGQVESRWYNMDGTLARTVEFDPLGTRGMLDVEEYFYNHWGDTTRAVSTQFATDDQSQYVSTEYLYDDTGNIVSYNDLNSVTGEKSHVDLTRVTANNQEAHWSAVQTRGTDGNTVIDRYDYDDDGVLNQHMKIENGKVTRLSEYIYYTDEQYDLVRNADSDVLDETIDSEAEDAGLLRAQIQQFSIPADRRPGMAELIRANGEAAVFGSAQEQAGMGFSEAYEKNGVFFYVESLPEAFFEDNYPSETLQALADAAVNGNPDPAVCGRAVYFGDADTLEIYGAELWLDLQGEDAEKIAVYAPADSSDPGAAASE